MNETAPSLPANQKGLGFLFPAVLAALRGLRRISVSYYLPEKSSYIDGYVLGCLAVLSCGGLILAFAPRFVCVAGLFAAYRLLDLIVFHLNVVLTGGFRGNKTFASYYRAIFFALENYIELVLANATMLFWLDRSVVRAFGQPLATFGNAVYVSVLTLTTSGYGEYPPSHSAAKAVVCVVLLASVLVLTQIIARFVSLPRPQPEEQSTPPTPCAKSTPSSARAAE